MLRRLLLRLTDLGSRLASAASTLLFRNQRVRWQRVASGGPPSWDDRNRVIARFIPDGASVIDLGAGPQTLRDHLGPACRYQPCDLVKGSDDVIVCDFNADPLPYFAPGTFSMAVCSGLLEYVRNTPTFLAGLSATAPEALVSYNVKKPGDSIFSRLARNWCNHFPENVLLRMFRDAGFQYEELNRSASGEVLYRLRVSRLRAADAGPQLR